ncbi:theronine dehydrogenase [Sarocladium strictum]
MQALRANSPSSGFQIETVPLPTVGPSDVLIKVSVAGISPGAVKMTRFGKARTPATLGHEAAGTVAAVGDAVQDLAVGTRVRLHPVLNCGSCDNCTRGLENLCDESAIVGFAKFSKHSELYDEYHDGTVAEYVRAPRRFVDRLPVNVSFEIGAKLHDVATALHAMKLAELKRPSTVVITAATGAMGALTARLAHLFPITKIILVGRSKSRLEQTSKLSNVPSDILVADQAGSAAGGTPDLATQLLALAPGGIDVVIDYLASGNIMHQLLPALRVGGTLVHMGGNQQPFPFPMFVVMNCCWKVTGGRANTREDVLEVLKWLEDGKLQLDDLITHRFQFADVHKMLELLESRNEPVWLSVLQISG